MRPVMRVDDQIDFSLSYNGWELFSVLKQLARNGASTQTAEVKPLLSGHRSGHHCVVIPQCGCLGGCIG